MPPPQSPHASHFEPLRDMYKRYMLNSTVAHWLLAPHAPTDFHALRKEHAVHLSLHPSAPPQLHPPDTPHAPFPDTDDLMFLDRNHQGFALGHIWGSTTTDNHPYSFLPLRASKPVWQNVRTRKFASDLTVHDALEHVEYVWFTDHRAIVILSRVPLSPNQPHDRVSEILYFPPTTQFNIPPQRPQLVLLAHHKSSCLDCAAQICVCQNSIGPNRPSIADLVSNTCSSPSDPATSPPSIRMPWEQRMRMVSQGNRRGLLTLYYFGPTAGDLQTCTVRQPYISSCANQEAIGQRIQQHLANLLSKFRTQNDTSMRSLAVDSVPAPLPATDDATIPFPTEFSQSPVSLTASLSNVNAPQKDSLFFEPPKPRPLPSDHAAQTDCNGNGDKSSCCPKPNPDAGTKCGSTSVDCSTKLDQDQTTVRAATTPSSRSAGELYSRESTFQNSVCGPDKVGKECECSAESMPDPSLALILNSRRDRLANPFSEITSFVEPVSAPVMRNTGAGRGLTIPSVSSIGQGSAEATLPDEESHGLGSLGGQMRFESQSPESARLGGGSLPSPLPLPSLISSEPPLKRPRAESSPRPDTFSLNALDPTWPSGFDEPKGIQLPHWNTSVFPDRPLSALGRALGMTRSPSPPLVTNTRKTSSPHAISSSVAGLSFPRSAANQEGDFQSSFESSGELMDEVAIKQQTATVNGDPYSANEPLKNDKCSREESRSVRDGLSGNGSDASSGNGVCCEICGIRFAKRSNKIRHIQTVHNRVKQFECELCGQKFGLKADLGRHRYRIHESRAFSCDKCGKSFAENEQLKLHVRVTHEEDSRPWECTQCRIRFGRKSSLTRHEQAVHERRRFTCRICRKPYSQKFDAIRHERKVHGLNAPSA